jgi:hypothetical protein
MDREQAPLVELIAAIIHGAGQAMLAIAPWLVRLGIVAAVIYVANGTLLLAMAGFGGDVAAWLPALALVLAPLALALLGSAADDTVWGRLLIAAIVVYLLRWLLAYEAFRLFVPVGLLMFCVVSLLSGGGYEQEIW